MTAPISIVVLISGSGSNLQSIIDGIAVGQIEAKIRAVISNVPDAYGLTRAETARIPTEVLDHTEFEDRETFDRELRAIIDHYSPEIIVLAGFMRRLTEDFVNQYMGKLLNIHPSLLPKYPGLHTHRKVLENGDTEHGASIHYVTPELDAGPVIIQSVVPVKDEDDEEQLTNRVHKEEHIIYPMVIGWCAERRLKLVDEHVHLDDIPLSSPVVRKDGNTILPESHTKTPTESDNTNEETSTSDTKIPTKPSASTETSNTDADTID